MSNIEVTVTAGYRCVFTTEQWRKFCQQLQDEVNSEFGSDDGSGSESGSDDGSGSDNGSDNGSHCSGCSDDDVSDNGAEMNVQTNLDKFICFWDGLHGRHWFCGHYDQCIG